MGWYAMNMPKRENFVEETFEEIPSTSLYLKGKYPEKKNRIVSAFKQSSGIGTKGRSFSSDEGGVYLSVLTFPTELSAKNAFSIMQNCAVSVCETLHSYGINACVKWPNDIYVNDKKICGILTENVFEKDRVYSSLVGIGINVYNVLPAELSEIAVTMSEIAEKEYNRADVIEIRNRLIENLLKEKEDVSETYRRHIGYIGEKIFLVLGDKRIPAILISVTDTGALIAETEKGEEVFYSAEVSLRLEKE